MPTCTLTIIDEVNIKFTNLDADTRKLLVKKFKYEDPTAKFRPSFKLGRWDGAVSFFAIGGTSYLYLLPEILEVLEQKHYHLEVEDLRKSPQLEFNKVTEEFWGDTCWPAGHLAAGKPIRLRTDQTEVVNTYLSNPQCLQSIATGFGKCLDYHTLLDINFVESSKIGRFLLIQRHHETFYQSSGNMTISIGRLIDTIQHYQNEELVYNQEIDVSELNIKLKTIDNSYTLIEHMIVKYSAGVELEFDSGAVLCCANGHVLYDENLTAVYARDLNVHDKVKTRTGWLKVIGIKQVPDQAFYDVAIAAPHMYCDHNDIVHHNTIVTATLAKVCEKYGRTLTIVPSKSLVEQTAEDFVNCGLDTGVYYGDKKELGRTHTICTWQSLSILDKKSKKKTAESDMLTLAMFLDNVNTVMVDECHIVSGAVLQNLLTKNVCNAPIRWGLTGTIPKAAIDQMQLKVSLGELVNEVKAADLQADGVLSNCQVHIKQIEEWKEFGSYAEELKYLVTDPERMKYVSDMIAEIALTGNTLVLVNRIESGTSIVENIPDAVFVSGAVKTKDRKEEYDEMKTSTNKIIVATYGVAAVGLNLPRIFNMVLLEPGKSFIRVIQSIGRGLRKADDKDHVDIYDITATTKYAKKHLTERKRFYRDAAYKFQVQKVSRLPK